MALSEADTTGVEAPKGDPTAIAQAAYWHDQVAGQLHQTAGLVTHTVGAAANQWEGKAATSYGELGLLVAEHFKNASSVASAAGDVLRRYASELEQLQKAGTHAVGQVAEWQSQLKGDQKALTNAETEVSTTTTQLSHARSQLRAAAERMVDNGGGDGSGAAYYWAIQVNSLQTKLGHAQAAQRKAQHAVDEDQREITRWQTRARQIWQDAENEASIATGSLTPLSVTPPPLAGAPTTFTGALSADSPFIYNHQKLADQLADQIAASNAKKNHLSKSDERNDRQTVLGALDYGKNLDDVKLSHPGGGGGLLQGLEIVGAVGITEILGGGPEDPAADGASAAEVEGIEAGAGEAAGEAEAGTVANDVASADAGVDANTLGEEAETVPSSQKYDPAAHQLADRIGGQAQQEFASGPNAGREFDAVSDEYVAQAKPANFKLSQSFRVQAKGTFQAAVDTGRTPYFQFDGPPDPDVIRALDRYALRYGVKPVIDTTPLGG